MSVSRKFLETLRQPSEINLGDHIRACIELGAGSNTCLEIARLLGVAAPAPIPQQIPTKTTPEDEDRVPISGQGIDLPPAIIPGLSVSGIEKRGDEMPGSEDSLDAFEIPADLIRLSGVQVDNSLNALENIPADSPASSAPEIPPLFKPQQTRTLLARALARVAHTGQWDFARVVEQCARGEALQNVPRMPEPTLSSGVQLLVDRSDTMMVFSQDQSKIELAMRKLVGDSKVQVLAFEGFPSRAGSGGKRRWKPYIEQLPPSGTVVAVLSDLGIGEAAWLSLHDGDWRAFAELLRRRGCPIVAFVPYHPSRWPRDLRHSITMIHWDRPTRTSAMRASVWLGLRVER